MIGLPELRWAPPALPPGSMRSPGREPRQARQKFARDVRYALDAFSLKEEIVAAPQAAQEPPFSLLPATSFYDRPWLSDSMRGTRTSLNSRRKRWAEGRDWNSTADCRLPGEKRASMSLMIDGVSHKRKSVKWLLHEFEKFRLTTSCECSITNIITADRIVCHHPRSGHVGGGTAARY